MHWPPSCSKARQQKLIAFHIAEKLMIEGKAYTFDTLDTLPASLDMSKAGIKKVTDNITAFYGSSCWFSNFRFSPFKDGKAHSSTPVSNFCIIRNH